MSVEEQVAKIMDEFESIGVTEEQVTGMLEKEAQSEPVQKALAAGTINDAALGAYWKVRADLTGQMATPMETYMLRVLSIGDPFKRKKTGTIMQRVAGIGGVVGNKDAVGIVSIVHDTGNGENVLDILDGVEKGKCYTIKASYRGINNGVVAGWVREGVSRYQEKDPIPEPLQSAKDFLEKRFDAQPIADIWQYQSIKNRNQIPTIMVVGQVTQVRPRTSDGGRRVWGEMRVEDESIYGPEEIEKWRGGLVVNTNSVEELQYGEGSRIMVIGQPSFFEFRDGSPGVNLRADIIVPIMAFPPKQDLRKMVPKDDIQVDDTDEIIIEDDVLDAEFEDVDDAKKKDESEAEPEGDAEQSSEGETETSEGKEEEEEPDAEAGDDDAESGDDDAESEDEGLVL